MAEPDWARVLKHLYGSNGVFHVELDYQAAPNEIRRKELLMEGLGNQMDLESSSTEELRTLFNHMENVKLINIVHGPDWAEARLTETGFEVAHERELNNRQNNTNRILAAVTAGLFFAAAIQALAAYYSVPEVNQGEMSIAFIGLGAAAIALVYVIIVTN